MVDGRPSFMDLAETITGIKAAAKVSGRATALLHSEDLVPGVAGIGQRRQEPADIAEAAAKLLKIANRPVDFHPRGDLFLAG